MKYFSTLFFIALCWSTAWGQDQHFSQFYASPLTLNPALTGAFEGKYRISLIYRDQWRKALDNPYQTFSAAADFRYPVKAYKRRYKDAVGVGILFYNDKVNQINLTTNQIMASGAYHKALNPESNQYLSLGVQVGMVQRNLNYDQLTFHDQFNGTDGFTNPSGEEFPENNFAFSDLQIGLNYSYAPEDKAGIFAGAAMHHITEPEMSFYYRQLPDEDKDERLSNTLLRKYTAHLALRLPLGEFVQLSPRAQVYSQGPHLTFNAGTNVRFLVNDTSGTAIHIGGWARPVHNQDEAWSMDAVVALLGIEHQNFLLGFSYDLNPGALNVTNSNRRAFEISVAYLGEYEDDSVQCPKF